jgi:hypothetical protein
LLLIFKNINNMKKILILILLYTACESRAQNEFVFLFDNSGSMSGYYRENESTFAVFSKYIIKNTVQENDIANISLFSKNEPKRNLESPKVLFSGKSKDLIVDKVFAGFKMIHANDGGFGTTDLIEAFDKSIENTRTDIQIIFLVTDNINDNSGTGDSSYGNTLEFYKRLRNDDNIKKILLYPIPEKVSEAGYSSKGYVVYGIIYSKKNISQADLEKYDKLLRSTGIKQKPITLKPLDIGTIVLVPKINPGKFTAGKLFFDGKTLRGFEFEEAEKIRETFSDLSLKSNLFPYLIRDAQLNVHLDDFKSSDYSVKSIGTQSITPTKISNVSPEGEVTGFTVVFNLPEISPKFSLNTVFKNDFTVGGNLILEVSGVDILLDDTYMNSFKELFALQSIPEIFKPVLRDKKIITQIPVEIRIKYGPWRIIVLIVLSALIISIFVIFAFFILRKKHFTLEINKSEKRTVCINYFSGYNLSCEYSPVLGKIKKSIFGNLIFAYSKFTTTPLKKIILKNDLPNEIEYEEENRKNSIIFIVSEKDSEKRKSTGDSSNEEFH